MIEKLLTIDTKKKIFKKRNKFKIKTHFSKN